MACRSDPRLHRSCSETSHETLPKSASGCLRISSSKETPGTKLHRTTYNYWFHLGESQAIRQMLGPTGKLPDFVGGFGKSQYRPER